LAIRTEQSRAEAVFRRNLNPPFEMRITHNTGLDVSKASASYHVLDIKIDPLDAGSG